MIYQTKEQLSATYGAPFPCLERRFNADDSTAHRNDAYWYEFGYLQGRCIYAIVQKSEGGTILPVEAASMMAGNGSGKWNPLGAADDSPDDAPDKKGAPHPVPPPPPPAAGNLAYTYTPVAPDAFYPAALFASHQLHLRQLVIYHPSWQVDLAQVECNPLT